MIWWFFICFQCINDSHTLGSVAFSQICKMNGKKTLISPPPNSKQFTLMAWKNYYASPSFLPHNNNNKTYWKFDYIVYWTCWLAFSQLFFFNVLSLSLCMGFVEWVKKKRNKMWTNVVEYFHGFESIFLLTFCISFEWRLFPFSLLFFFQCLWWQIEHIEYAYMFTLNSILSLMMEHVKQSSHIEEFQSNNVQLHGQYSISTKKYFSVNGITSASIRSLTFILKEKRKRFQQLAARDYKIKRWNP